MSGTATTPFGPSRAGPGLGAALRAAGIGVGAAAPAGGLPAAGGGVPAASAFDTYKNSTGFTSRLKAGSDAIVGSNASRGGLNSGATLKALQTRGQEIGSAEFSNYLGQLGGLANAGLAAGQTIGSAGSSAGAAGAGAVGAGYGAAAGTMGQGYQNALGSLGYAANSAWDEFSKPGNVLSKATGWGG